VAQIDRLKPLGLDDEDIAASYVKCVNTCHASKLHDSVVSIETCCGSAALSENVSVANILKGNSFVHAKTQRIGKPDGLVQCGRTRTKECDDTADTTVFVDVNGDDAFNAADDMEISLTGVTGATVPVAADFLV
jgi:hypothetical protein